jgi:hypothetical protein
MKIQDELYPEVPSPATTLSAVEAHLHMAEYHYVPKDTPAP